MNIPCALFNENGRLLGVDSMPQQGYGIIFYGGGQFVRTNEMMMFTNKDGAIDKNAIPHRVYRQAVIHHKTNLGDETKASIKSFRLFMGV